MQTFNVDLWKQAQQNAMALYEEENGGGSWEEADKYEREDYVWDEYEKLRKESDNMTQLRDSKGRFISNKGNNETTNINLNQKGNDTMMNKKLTNAEERTMKLSQAGVDTSNFFNLNLQIPFGAEVKLSVDGKEMVIPATPTGIIGTYSGKNVEMYNGDLIDAKTGEALVMANDSIAQSIINDGYVKNNKLFRRWIFAQTIHMLDYVDPKNPNRKGWEACFHDCYNYDYQFKMLADELHTLAILQKEDPEQFAERTKFFNGDVVVATLDDYLRRLKKYCKKQMREHPRKYRGNAYVKLDRYGNVLIKDLDSKVYNIIDHYIDGIAYYVKQNNYKEIEDSFKIFMNKYYNKLPYNTPKCAVFKDVFKGAGGFYSLQNGIRFHGLILDGCRDKYESEKELYRILDNTPNSDVWSFHNLLVSTMELNKFDLKKSIANGNAAKNTTSTRANVYKR